MNKLYLSISILIWSSLQLSAQELWVHSQSGNYVDETLAVTGDAMGNTYSTGYFSASADVNGITLYVAGLSDIFITKTEPDGNNAWSVSAGGNASDRGLGIAVDNELNVIITGFYSGTMNFGNGVSLSSQSGSQDAFLAKYSSQGEIIWARSGGGEGNADRANDVAVALDGSIYITGQYTGAASFGSLSLPGASGSNDIFIVKYSSDGDELWAKTGNGSGNNSGKALACADDGSIYITGSFSDDITFDNPYANTITNASFVIAYTSGGDEQWFSTIGGSGQIASNAIDAENGSIYITGNGGSTVDFIMNGNINTENSGYTHSVFIAAYSQSGIFQWSDSQGSTSSVAALGIDVSGTELAITGWYNCTFESVSDEYGESAFNSIGFQDAYVMRYNTTGSFNWARNFGSQNNERGNDVYILPDNYEVICGVFRDRLNIPVINLNNVSGLVDVENSTNQGVTYCNDPSYGIFGKLLGVGNEDGFLIKAIDPERSPYDYYSRSGTGCDLSIADACAYYSGLIPELNCPDTVVGCAPLIFTATNQIINDDSLGYDSNLLITPFGFISQSTDVSATITSEDGCYTTIDTVYAEVFPSPAAPLLSDDVIINSSTANTMPIFLCPGQTVDLWADFPDNYTFSWSGPAIGSSQQNNDTVTVDEAGNYTITVTAESGCTNSTTVFVEYYVDPAEIAPYM